MKSSFPFANFGCDSILESKLPSRKNTVTNLQVPSLQQKYRHCHEIASTSKQKYRQRQQNTVIFVLKLWIAVTNLKKYCHLARARRQKVYEAWRSQRLIDF